MIRSCQQEDSISCPCHKNAPSKRKKLICETLNQVYSKREPLNSAIASPALGLRRRATLEMATATSQYLARNNNDQASCYQQQQTRSLLGPTAISFPFHRSLLKQLVDFRHQKFNTVTGSFSKYFLPLSLAIVYYLAAILRQQTTLVQLRIQLATYYQLDIYYYYQNVRYYATCCGTLVDYQTSTVRQLA